jgi:uncharacterized protein
MTATARAMTIGPVTAQPGSVASGTLTIPPLGGDAGTTVPITIVNGTSPGAVLALVAGVHGMEYVPIIALQRLRGAIDPATLHGTVIMVHVANMPSFLGRTIYYSPIDGRNLNRVFPGRADGSISERIAHAITTEVVERATHLLDLHGGDGNEWLRPYAYWITSGDPKVVAASRELVLAFGLDRIVVDDERPTDPALSMYLSNTAITRGKPAITAETGCLARVEEPFINGLIRGVMGVLRHLGMRDDGPPPVASPTWLTRNSVLRTSNTGLFYPAVACEQMVERGALIGRVTDLHGAVLEEVHAPFGGEILYVVATPPVSKGEPLAMVAAGPG